jgi:hypothetical protein
MFTCYLGRVGIAFSILLNVILGGPNNQTFSARNYHQKLNKKPNIVWLIDLVFWFDPQHCFHSWVYYKTTKDLRAKHKVQDMVKNSNARYVELDYYEME